MLIYWIRAVVTPENTRYSRIADFRPAAQLIVRLHANLRCVRTAKTTAEGCQSALGSAERGGAKAQAPPLSDFVLDGDPAK